MRINIFMLYNPLIRLTGEGIGRHTAKIFEGLIKLNADVCIVAPYWLRHPVKELLRDEGVEYEDKNLRYNEVGNPIFYIIYLLIMNRRSSSLDRYQTSLSRKLSGFIRYAFRVVMEFLLNYSAKGVVNFIITFPVLLTLGFISVPIVFTILLLSTIKEIGRKFSVNQDKIERRVPIIKAFNDFVKKALWGIFNRLYKYEVKTFVSWAKAQKCDIWYSPAAFWEEFNEMPQPRVMCVPDLSPIQFAGSYIKDAANANEAKEAVDRIKRAIERCDLLFTYNRTAFTQSVSSAVSVLDKDIYEIDHAAMRLDDEICVMGRPVNSHEVSEFAKSRLKNAISSNSLIPYFAKLNLDGVDFLIYPTRVRPNKNIMNLVRALEYLIRTRRRSIKLILTDDYTRDENLNNYIKDKRLQYEVLSLGRQSPQTIAALYKCASLAVSSAKFEGSLPFTVTEALSVRTPIVITRTLVSKMAIPSTLDGDMCFEGDNYKDIARRIEWALDNREQLLERQINELSHLLDRTWGNVAGDYYNSFREIIKSTNIDELRRRDNVRREEKRKMKIREKRFITGYG